MDSDIEVRESAAYGKACSGCAKAKCRCILRGEGLSCERCHRLARNCRPSAVIRKRGPPRPARRSTRLEQRLDDLVTLLKSQAESGAAGAPQAEKAPVDGHRVPCRPAEPSESSRAASARSEPKPSKKHMPGTLGRSPDSSLYETPHDSPLNEPSASEAERCLETFRTHHLQAFPFVFICPSTSAAEVKRDRPFLWLNIRATCSKSYVEQRALETKVREILAQKLLVDLERSLDMLLGLITYLSWAVEKYRGKPLLSAFSNLATTLLFDLRLDRGSQEIPCREINVSKAYSHPIKQVVPAVNRSNEERRAILGCYVVTATIAWFLRTKPVGWTAHMEACLLYLADEPETPGDSVLVATTRLLRLMEEVHSISKWRNIESPPLEPQFYVKGLRIMLEDIKRKTHPEVLQNRVVLSHLSMVEALIHELPLFTWRPARVIFEKTEWFYSCLGALKLCVENFLSFTPEEAFCLPMPLHLQFSRSTHILYRLLLLDDPACDRAAVLGTVDLFGAVEQCAALYAAVPGAVGLETSGDDMFTRTAEVLRATAPTWRRALEEAGAIPGATIPSVNSTEQDDMLSTDFLTDWWFADIFSVGGTL